MSYFKILLFYISALLFFGCSTKDYTRELYNNMENNKGLYKIEQEISRPSEIKFKDDVNISLTTNSNSLKETLANSTKTYSIYELLDSLKHTSTNYMLARLETSIAKEELRAKYAEYYPGINLSISGEYSKKYSDIYPKSSYVGDESVTQSSGYQSQASISLGYDLMRFGATNDGVIAAKESIISREFNECKVLNDTKLYLLEYYYQALITKQRLDIYSMLIDNYAEIYENSKRLNLAGEIDKTDLENTQLELLNLNSQFVMLGKNLNETIAQIAYVSGADIKSIDQLVYFSYMGEDVAELDFLDTAQAGALIAKINQKRALLQEVKKEYYPRISLYAKYDFYGHDKDNFSNSIDNTKRNGYRVGISVSYNIFDGFRREAKSEIAKIEYLKANIELEDAKRAYDSQRAILKANIQDEKKRLAKITQAKVSSKNITDMNYRLNVQGERSINQILNSHNEYLRKLLESNESHLNIDMLKIKKSIIYDGRLCG